MLYVEAAKINPHLGYFYNHGVILEKEGRMQEAEAVYETASMFNDKGGRLSLYQDTIYEKSLAADRAVCA